METTKRQDERLDKTGEDSFPASDPPPTAPKAGSRKAEQEAAHRAGQANDEDNTPKGSPSSDRHAAETAAQRIDGGDAAEEDNR